MPSFTVTNYASSRDCDSTIDHHYFNHGIRIHCECGMWKITPFGVRSTTGKTVALPRCDWNALFPGYQDVEFEPVAAPLRGWRTWNLDEKRGMLVGVGLHVTWKEQVTKAKCANGAICLDDACPTCVKHVAPFSGCACGIWVMPSEEDMRRVLGSYVGARVAGEVEFWGRIIKHAKGYRAQYARPLSLTVYGPVHTKVVAQLEKRYLCPVEVRSTRPTGRPSTAYFSGGSRSMMSTTGQNVALVLGSQGTKRPSRHLGLWSLAALNVGAFVVNGLVAATNEFSPLRLGLAGASLAAAYCCVSVIRRLRKQGL